jgi:anti-sigma factor RsiW
MIPQHLPSLLAAGAPDDPARSAACPDEHEIAGYVDGELDAAARQRVEGHLADCGHCLELVGLLCREHGAGGTEPACAEIATPARDPAARSPRRPWWLAPQWAAAATLILAVPLLLQLGRNPDRGAGEQESPEPRATRMLAPTPAGLQVLAPGAGAAVDGRRLSFRWTDVAGTPYYDVRIVTDAGDVVVQQRVTGTTWQPTAQLGLQPGAEYFVHVDAYPAGDKPVSSGHVPFRIAD